MDLTGSEAGTGFAIHPDGALYHVEAATGTLVGANIGLGEGAQVPLPRGLARHCAGPWPENPGTCTEEPTYWGAGTPTVLADGTVVVPVNTSTDTDWPAPGGRMFVPGLTLFFLRPDGTTATQIVQPSTGTSIGQVALEPFKAIPNGQGGVLVGWTTVDTLAGSATWRAHLAAVDADGTVHGPTGWWGRASPRWCWARPIRSGSRRILPMAARRA